MSLGMCAAPEAGVNVPKLCATDALEAFGSCRLCLVEIDGRRGTPASQWRHRSDAAAASRRRSNLAIISVAIISEVPLLRANIEKAKGSQNKIDPMQMKAFW